MKYKFFFFACIVALLLSIWAVSPWLFSNKILYFWDSYLPFDPANSFKQLFYFWRDGLFPGYQSAGWNWLPYWVLFFTPYVLTHSLPISEAFIYILLLVFSIINFYCLALNVLKTLFNNLENSLLLKVSALIAGLLYAFNVYTFFNFYFMFNPGAFILAFLPLNILALMHLYPLENKQVAKRNVWKLIFLVSLLLMIPGFGVYVFFLQYLVWVFVYLCLSWILSKRKLISLYTVEVVLFYLIIIFVNLWWFYPAFLGFSVSYGGQSSFGTTEWFDKGFKPSELLYSFRLMGSGLMINNKFSWNYLYEQNFIFTFPLFIFPALFVISLAYLKKKVNSLLVFFLTITLISLFIVKFSNPPYDWILSLAYHYVPFFGGFRDASQKAGVYYIFGYFIFVSVGLVIAIDFLVKKRKIALYAFLTVLVFGSIILSGPFFLFSSDNIRKISFTFQNKQYTFNAKTEVPPEYYQLKNFIEGRCKGETIALVPRSGFVTDGVWNKYGASYVGQDMLAGLINCSFLSTAMFNYYAESSIRAPYFHLQNKDFQSFKNYLLQNGIHYVLIRHDFLPQGFVTWIYVNPQMVENALSQDNSYARVYQNDFFSLYKLKNEKRNQYGFHITQDVVQLQSDIKSGIDYTVASKVIGDVRQPVIPNSSQERLRYKKDVSRYVSIANCIGCIQLELGAKTKTSSGFWNDIKRFIKTVILHKNQTVPPEIEISNEAVLADETVTDVLKAADKRDQKRFDQSVKTYISRWNRIEYLLKNYKTDKFLLNNKYMEVSNFLTREKNALYSRLSSQYLQKGKFLNKKKNRIEVVSLFSFQGKLLERLLGKVTQTNFKNMDVEMRLDIPQTGSYNCEAINIPGSLDYTSVMLNAVNLAQASYTGTEPIRLNKGSYFVKLTYQPHVILKKNEVFSPQENTKEISVGYLKQGSYSVHLQIGTQISGRIIIAVTNGRKPGNILQYINSVEEPGSNFVFVDQLNKDAGVSMDYTKNFDIDLPSNQDYFLYLYHLNPQNNMLDISNLVITNKIDASDVQFACRMKTAKQVSNESIVSVKQVNPAYYNITLPVHYQGFLVFNQTFDANWVAHEKNSNSMLPHAISGYANAWHIDNLKKREIIVEYKTQNTAVRSAIITIAITIVLVLLYLKISKK